MLSVFMGIFLVGSFIWAIFLINRLFKLDEIDKEKRIQGDYYISLSELERTRFLDQHIPLSKSDWTLSKCYQKTRIWSKLFHYGRKFSASSFRVKNPAKNLLSFIDNTSQFRLWRPDLELCSGPVENEEGSLITSWRQKKLRNSYLCSDNILAWWLEPLLEEQITVTRTLIEGSKYSFLVEQTLPYYHTTIYIAQPVLALENDQCVLTVITDGDITRVVDDCVCLVEHFALQRAPVEHISQDDELSLHEAEQSDISDVASDKPNKNTDTTSHIKQKADCNDTDSSPTKSVPVTKIIPAEKPEIIKEEVSKNNGGEVECHTDGDIGNLSGTDSEFNSSVEIKKRPRPTSLTQTLFKRDFDSTPNLVATANGGSPSPRRRFGVFKSRSLATPEHVKSPLAKSHSEDISTQEVQRQEQVNGYKNVVFLRSNSQDENSGLIDYKTLANKCAADILKDVHEASNITQKPKGSEEVVTQGWVFDSTDRDVVILEKITPGRIQCLLGKGLIKCSPEVVRQTLINPYTRFLHDELLKDVTVICDFGDGMKLVKLVYSTNQFLRKDNREFYVLQAMRKDNQKYVLSMCSVEWPDAVQKDCPRGKFEASGWVIDPIVSKHNHTYSMVTYISRIDLGDVETSGKQQFVEEFISKQPYAIAEIREYLTSHDL